MKEKHLRLRWPFRLSAVAVSMMVLGWTSCEKIKDSEKVDIIIPYYVETFGGYFEAYRHSEAMTDDSLRKCAAHPYVRRIFIAIPYNFEQDFKKLGSRRISRICSELSGKMAISPKISGRGNFRFRPGVCPENDSLSFLAMGFTINQQERLYNNDRL